MVFFNVFLILLFSAGFIAAGDESITRKKPSVESSYHGTNFLNIFSKKSRVATIAEENDSSQLDDQPLQRLCTVEDDISGLDKFTVDLRQRSQSPFSKFFKSFDRKPSRVSPFTCIIEEDENSPNFLLDRSLSQVDKLCQLIVHNKFDDAYKEMTDLSSRGFFDTDALQDVCLALNQNAHHVSPHGHVDFVQREQDKLRFSNSVKPAFDMSQMVCDARELRSMSKSR